MSKSGYKLALASSVLASMSVMASSIGVFANAQPVAPPPPSSASVSPSSNPISHPDSSKHNAAQNLAACIQGSKSADILLVIDETGSLVGAGSNTEATDAEARRVDAAKNFAREMAHYADDNNANINVKLAGFDQEFRSYGSWQSLTVVGDGTNVDGDIDAFRDRTDGSYTDYAAGLNGAAEAVGDATSPCKSVMFFSDGFPNREQGGADAVMRDVCGPSGPVGRLRAAGVLVFTVGLAPNRSTQDTPELRRISEGECSGVAADGQHLFANDPSKLLDAFRQMVPGGGSFEADNEIGQAQEFTLDNSITTVRVSAQPDSTVHSADQLVPYLVGPDGNQVELKPGSQTAAGHQVNLLANNNVPGGFDIDLVKGAGDWAGRWAFGYKPLPQPKGQYHVKLIIQPGLSIGVDNDDSAQALSLKADSPLAVSLLNKDGNRHALEGTADLQADIVREDGSSLALGTHDISSGHVDLALGDVSETVRGTLRLSAAITTKGADDSPGTPLAPIVFEKPISIVPVNAPNIPAAATLRMSGTEGSFEIPVTGPGEIWVESGTIDANGTQVSYSSDNDSANPLTLGRGESGTIVVKAAVENPIDAAITGQQVEVSYKDSDGKVSEPVKLAVNGSITAPVDKVAFGVALVVVLALGILIPIGLLYLIRYLTGKIPTKPGIHVLRIPVTVEDSRLMRQDTGREFDVDYDRDFLSAPRETSNGRLLNAGGLQVKVRTGFNPLEPAQAVVDASMTISDDGKQTGGRAILPLAVHNHWFALVDQNNPADKAIVVLCGEDMAQEHLERLVKSIQAKGASRVDKLAQQAAQATRTSASEGKKKSRPRGSAKANSAAAMNAPVADNQAGGVWGQPAGEGQPDDASGNNGWGAPSNGGFGDSVSGFGSDSGLSFGSGADAGGWGQPDGSNDSFGGGWDGSSWGDNPQRGNQQGNDGGFAR